MKRARLPAASALAAALLALAGCAPVQPWERGVLARPQMALDPFPGQSAWRSHVQSARQAASLGGSAEGGGCGCY